MNATTTHLIRILSGFVTCLLLFSLPVPATTNPRQPFKNRKQAMTAFAGLLKIPLEPPRVSVTVKSTQQEDGLVIEDISWKALDEDEPFAYVIRPTNATKPLAAIVCLHGSSGSRESEVAQTFGMGDWIRYGDKVPQQRLLGWARELSRRGFLTLTLTQRGLDRRLPDTNDQAKDLLVRGRTLMGAIVQEIRQSVTYLQSRPDVDRSKIGMTGMSFGGITTFYTWLVDDRIAAAAPICGGVGSVDTFLKMGRRSYHGFYWWVPDMLTLGDQGDFAAALAPRPLMLWAPTEDIGMPKEGVQHFVETARPAYEKSPAPKALVVHRPPGEHSFTLEAFAAMEKFFREWLKP
jgi:dienelactone hydrolase